MSVLVVDPTIAEIPLGSCLVLLRQGGRALFILNESASLIYKSLQNGESIASINKSLSTKFDITSAQAVTDSALLMEQWHASGILGKDHSPRVNEKPLFQAPIRQDPHSSSYSSSSSFSMAGHLVTVQHNSPELKASLTSMFPQLEHAPVDVPDFMLTADLVDGAYTLINNGVLVAKANSQDQLIVEIISELVNIPSDQEDLFCVLHACCIARDNISMVLAGSGGSGKTTLTAALIQSGYGFVTDDVTPLRSNDLPGKPAAIQMNLCIKQGSFEPLQQYYPDLITLPTFNRFGQTVRFLPPPPKALWPVQPPPVSVVIFPEYAPAQAGETREISHVDALELLVVTDSKIGPQLDKEKFTRLIEWLQTTRCFCVTFPNTKEGMDRVGVINDLVTGEQTEPMHQSAMNDSFSQHDND